MTVYASPGTESYRSDRFAAVIDGEEAYVYGIERDALVYLQDHWEENAPVQISFVTCSTATVAVVALQFLGGAITSYRIYSQTGYQGATVADDVLTLTLAQGSTVWVVVNEEYGEPCMVRALTPIATPSIGGSVVAFNGSQTEVATNTTLVFTQAYCDSVGGTISLGQQFPIRSGGTAFIEGGAVVEGSFDLSQDDNTDVDGHGVMSGAWSSPEAVALISDFDTKLTYSMIYALEPDFAHSGSRIRGITIVNPPFYSVFGANTAVDVMSIGIWAPNCDGLHLAADPSQSNVFSADNCLVWSCDDTVNLSEYIGAATITNCLLGSVAGATLLVGYWPAINYGLATTVQDCTLVSMQEWGDNNGVLIQAWSDGEADEESHVIADYTFRGLRVVGPNPRAMFLYTANLLYPWGTQGAAKGRISGFVFDDITIETTPSVLSIIGSRDSFNTPSGVAFKDLTIGGVPVSARNHGTYFDIDEECFNITFDGRGV